MASTQPEIKWKTTRVTIQAGSTYEVPVEVDVGSEVNWAFQTEKGDIAFNVFFIAQDTPDKVEEVVEKDRIQADDGLIQARVKISRKGQLFLQWDNSYSWFNNKELLYSVTLNERADGTPAAAAAAGQTDSPGKNGLDPNTKVVFVLGPPGSGKGTQCERLSADFGMVHLSAGDLLRAERNNPDSADGKLISQYIKEGKIVPIAITIKLLLQAMEDSDAASFLVDGFPRNKDNVDGWISEVGDKVNVVGVFYFDCPEEVVQERLLERGKTSGRSDDNIESIRKRFHTYITETMPVIEFFQDQGKVWKIDCNQPIETVYGNVSEIVRNNVLDIPGSSADVDPAPTTTSEADSSAESTNKPHTEGTVVVASAKKPPRVVLGTMTFGVTATEADSLALMEMFVASEAAKTHTTGNGKSEIDTARMYGGGNVEKLLARLFANPRAQKSGLVEKLYVATKANPFKGMGNDLRPSSVLSQLAASLAALNSDSVDLFYLHSPDRFTPIEATLEACQTLYEQGKFRELGLSNYPAWEVVHIYHLCKERGWVRPTVYQGMYNGITRAVEDELFAALRLCNMRFYAYNPLAGGMLSGRYLDMEDLPTKGRFAKGTAMGKMYQGRYFKPSYFDAIKKLSVECSKHDITVSDAAIRWLMHHSKLQGGEGDAVILGASKLTHLEQNLDACIAGKLPDNIVRGFDEAWETCKSSCPGYARDNSIRQKGLTP